MQAIETIYNSYRFRSRLEARWAIFFDRLGIPYQYEAEGFELETTRYLPDFWLPNQQVWFEIKGQELTEREEEKCMQFAKEQPLFVSVGSIPIPGEDDCNMIYKYTADDRSEGYQWIECPFCDNLNIVKDGSGLDLSCQCVWHSMNLAWIHDAISSTSDPIKLDFVINKLFRWNNTPNLMIAYTAARQARFEHGERTR